MKKENDILEKTLDIAESGYDNAYLFLLDAYGKATIYCDKASRNRCRIFGTGKHSPSVSDRDVHIKRIMEKHTMKKSYEKNELTFALVWIVIYCVLQSQSTFC